MSATPTVNLNGISPAKSETPAGATQKAEATLVTSVAQLTLQTDAIPVNVADALAIPSAQINQDATATQTVAQAMLKPASPPPEKTSDVFLFRVPSFDDVDLRDLPSVVDGIDDNVNSFHITWNKKKGHAEEVYFSFLSNQLHDTPALLLNMQKEFTLSPWIRNQTIAQNLKLVADSAQSVAEEADHLQGEKNTKQGYLPDSKEVRDLKKTAADFRANQYGAEEKKELLRNQWKKQKNTLYNTLKDVLAGKKTFKELYSAFLELRKLNHQAFAPFVPFLALLFPILPNDLFEEILTEAKNCNQYLTYAFVVTNLQITLRDKEHCPTALRALKALQKHFPTDIVLPGFVQAVSINECDFTFQYQPLEKAIVLSLSKLASNDLDQAIKILVVQFKYMCGFSILHRYLALYLALNGNVKRAKDALQNSYYVLKLETRNFSSQYCLKTIYKIYAKLNAAAGELPKLTPTPLDPLEEFIKLAALKSNDPEFVAQASAFVKAATASLQKSTESLIIIYFCIKWLNARLVVLADQFEKYRELYLVLGELVSVVVTICYKLKVTDSWFLETFKKYSEDGQESFTANFSNITFGLQMDALIPIIEFYRFETTRESEQSLGICLARELHGLVMGMMIAEHVSKEAKDWEDMPLPDDQSIFLAILRYGIQDKNFRTDLFPRAREFLNAFLTNPTQRNYTVIPSILSWASFGAFSLSLCLDDTVLSMKAARDYFTPQLIERHKSITASIGNTFKVDALALRDAILAAHALSQPTRPVHPWNQDDFYTVFKCTQALFCWRFDESFEAWGQRLQSYTQDPLLQSEAAFLKNRVNGQLQPLFDQIPTNSGKAREVLRKALYFWIQFHKKTKEKNLFIQKGGNDDATETTATQWIHDIKDKKRHEMIEKNDPKLLPNFALLPPERRKSLAEWVAEKHKHYLEIQDVKRAWTSLNNNKKIVDDLPIIAAAQLMTATEESRSKSHHSIFINDEKLAMRVYQILLWVTTERMMRFAIMALGPDYWKIDDIAKPEALFSKSLHCLLDSLPFHGPEIHCTGNGPLQNHYNAAVFTSSESAVNTHIYYP